MRDAAVILVMVIGCTDTTELTSTICGGPCYTGPAWTEGVGECKAGMTRCEDGEPVECVGEVTPQAELCDGRHKDDNCDHRVDEWPRNIGCGSDVGACKQGEERCVAGRIVCWGEVVPEVERCDGFDRDCDTVVDNIKPTPCYDGPVEGLLHEPCRPGHLECVGGSETCVGQILPQPEVCDQLEIDEDCDGAVNEGTSQRDVDIVFIVDGSGSMIVSYPTVIGTIESLSSILSGPLYRKAIIWAPNPESNPGLDPPEIFSDFVPMDEILNFPSRASGTGNEPTYDALWGVSTGTIALSWRNDSSKVQILFSDEPGHSNRRPRLTESEVTIAAGESGHSIYIFTRSNHFSTYDEIVSQAGGDLNPLSDRQTMATLLAEELPRCEQ